MISYRDAVVADAEQIVRFYNRVGGETSFLSFEKDEYPMNAEEQADEITAIGRTDNNRMLLALDGEEIVGIATIHSSQKIKGRHCGELGIVVSASHHHQGIGTALMENLIGWAKSNGVTTRIDLETRTDNPAAALYEKLGFEHEGIKRKSTLLHGVYYDLYIMAMLL